MMPIAVMRLRRPADPSPDVPPVALLHFDGANGSTVFTDETGRMWAASAPAALTTSDFKFGGASGAFGGAGAVSTGASADLAFGTGDFTVEFFLKTTTSRAGTGAVGRMLAHPTVGNVAGVFQIWQNDEDARFGTVDGITLADPLGTTDTICDMTGVVITDGLWHHAAFTRQGTTVRGFFDGVLRNTQTDATNFTRGGTDGVRIGNGPSGATPFTGNIDELRITKGLARYTASFSPPTAPFSYP